MPILNSFYAWLLAILTYGSIDFKDYTLLQTNDKGYSFYLDESESFIIQATIDNHLEAYTRTNLGEHEDFIDPFVIEIQSNDSLIIAGVTGIIIKGNMNGADIDTWCFVQSLWVDEAYRDQGLGSLLMAKVQDYAQHQNCKMIRTEAFEIDQSKLFFEKMGFNCYVTLPHPRNVHFMSKSVDGFDDNQQNSTIDLSDKGYQIYMGFPLFINTCDLCTFSQMRKYFTNSIIHLIWSDEAKKRADAIDQKVSNYRELQGATRNESKFTIFMVSPENKIIGGAFGTIENIPGYGKWCHICDVAIDEEYRKQRLGGQLFSLIDEYAQNKNCKHSELWTGEWQARGFYEKVGYTTIVTMPRSEHAWNQEGYILRKYFAGN